MNSNHTIRLANKNDTEVITAFNLIAQKDSKRAEFIKRSIDADECYRLEIDKEITAYGILNYHFYEQALIEMIYVHSDYRRSGLGTTLLNHFVSICKTEKLFTSTNQSNAVMQNLLKKAGFEKSRL